MRSRCKAFSSLCSRPGCVWAAGLKRSRIYPIANKSVGESWEDTLPYLLFGKHRPQSHGQRMVLLHFMAVFSGGNDLNLVKVDECVAFIVSLSLLTQHTEYWCFRALLVCDWKAKLCELKHNNCKGGVLHCGLLLEIFPGSDVCDKINRKYFPQVTTRDNTRSCLTFSIPGPDKLKCVYNYCTQCWHTAALFVNMTCWRVSRILWLSHPFLPRMWTFRHNITQRQCSDSLNIAIETWI